MQILEQLAEYYDELLPVPPEKLNFYENLCRAYKPPAHILSLFCGTGLFESALAKFGYDITGVEDSKELIKLANLRRRNQLMSVRFFLMKAEDATEYLGKGFYNLIFLPRSSALYFGGADSFSGYLRELKELLSPDGCVVIETENMERFAGQDRAELPVRQSVRSRLLSELYFGSAGRNVTINLETGNGEIVNIATAVPVYPAGANELRSSALRAGFGEIELFSGYNREEITEQSENIIAVLRVNPPT